MMENTILWLIFFFYREHANNINKKLEVVKKQLKTMDNYNRFINEEIDKTMDM